MRPYVSVEANFGNNPATPFIYDIDECPGLVYKRMQFGGEYH
jgi:hypothetical protein